MVSIRQIAYIHTWNSLKMLGVEELRLSTHAHATSSSSLSFFIDRPSRLYAQGVFGQDCAAGRLGELAF